MAARASGCAATGAYCFGVCLGFRHVDVGDEHARALIGEEARRCAADARRAAGYYCHFACEFAHFEPRFCTDEREGKEMLPDCTALAKGLKAMSFANRQSARIATVTEQQA